MSQLQQNATSLLFIYGAGGHARVVADILAATGRSGDVGGVVDDSPAMRGARLNGHRVIGGRAELDEARSLGRNVEVIVTIGDNARREHVAAALRADGFKFATAIHPAAVIGSDVSIGAGSVIMPGVVINAGTRIGEHVIVNTAATVDHDSVVEDFAHICPGAHLAGQVHVGRGALVGTGASAVPGVRIGAGSSIGAGSAVMRDVPRGAVAIGVPARVMQGKRRLS